MPRTRHKLVGAAIAVGALGFGLAACGDEASLPDGVVAQFGDFQVTELELDRAVEQQVAQAQQQQQSAPQPGSPEYDDLRRQVLESLRVQRLVEVESKKCGAPCSVTEKDVDAELKRVRDESFQGSQRRLDDFLKESKLTQEDARRILKFTLQQPKLFNHVTRKVRFTEDDARKYYNENKAQFNVPAGRTARHILVATKPKADDIKGRITDANFADIARKESTDKGSGAQGGDLGPIQRGQLVPEFEKVAFELKDKEISAPVKTQFGWHIIQVEVTPARTTPFGEAKAQIVQSQLQQKRNEEFEAFRKKIFDEWDERAEYADSKLEPPSTDATTDAAPEPPADGPTEAPPAAP